jgi:hypothetical protein
MQSGRDALLVLSDQIQKTQVDLNDTNRQLEAVTQQLTHLNQEMGETYRRLARVRLNDLMAERIAMDLDDKDRATLAVLETRKSDLADLRQRIEASLSNQRRLEADRKTLADTRDATGHLLNENLEKSTGRIEASDAFTAQHERLAKAEEVARLAEEKALEAERNRQEKGAPYEADTLFMYLWNRRYLTPDYTGSWFTKPLDGWVAGLIDFNRNRANYHLLLEIPTRLRDHARSSQEKAEQEKKALQDIETSGLAADGIPAIRSQVEISEKALADHDDAIVAEEARYRELLDAQNQFNEMADPHSQKAMKLQEDGLKSEPMQELLKDAATTTGPEDDAAVARIQALKKEIDLKISEAQTLQSLQRQRQQSLLEMETLRRRYRQEGYDAYHTTFPNDFSLGNLLGQLITGAINSEIVWQEIGRHRRTWDRMDRGSGRQGSPWGPSWPRNPNRGGGFGGGGGFGTGGGFGGGGGGGGFKTGGQF